MEIVRIWIKDRKHTPVEAWNYLNLRADPWPVQGVWGWWDSQENIQVLGCYASFVEKNPYETRNTNLISPDVATKL